MTHLGYSATESVHLVNGFIVPQLKDMKESV